MTETPKPPTIHSLRLVEIARYPESRKPWEMEIINNDPDLKRQYERLINNPLQVYYQGNGVIRYQR